MHQTDFLGEFQLEPPELPYERTFRMGKYRSRVFIRKYTRYDGVPYLSMGAERTHPGCTGFSSPEPIDTPINDLVRRLDRWVQEHAYSD